MAKCSHSDPSWLGLVSHSDFHVVSASLSAGFLASSSALLLTLSSPATLDSALWAPALRSQLTPYPDEKESLGAQPPCVPELLPGLDVRSLRADAGCLTQQALIKCFIFPSVFSALTPMDSAAF